MVAKLSKSASGARHLRWAREILATERAHLDHNDSLNANQKAALASESATLSGLVDALAARVVPYWTVRQVFEHSHRLESPRRR
jgi:hypothetical protein